jgi:phage terminase large subunit
MCRRDVRHWFDNWVWTFNPKLAAEGRAAYVPMDLFPRQVDLLDWFDARVVAGESGAVAKSQDIGFTWLCGGYAVHRFIWHDGWKTGFGSRKAQLVDKLGDPDSIFEKIRMILRALPAFMLPRYSDKEMQILNESNGNTIRGEAGDQIGRGGRSSIYFLDEFAFVERADLVDAATGANCNVRIFGSSANGTSNNFYRKVNGGLPRPEQVFRFHWTDDPRKTQEWAEKTRSQMEEWAWNSAYEINFAASVEGGVIPHAWVVSAIDACRKLGISPTGQRRAALDVADEGGDMCAFASALGVEVDVIDEWSGRGGDIYRTTERAIGLCDVHGAKRLRYDADGLGAGVRGDARMINEARVRTGAPAVEVDAFRGSAPPVRPDSCDEPGRKNKDYFANAKAQAWWALRRRFRATHRWVTEGIACSPDDIVSIRSDVRGLTKLCSQLAQPTYEPSGSGKIVINKLPDGSRSPDMADAVMELFAPGGSATRFDQAMLGQLAGVR